MIILSIQDDLSFWDRKQNLSSMDSSVDMLKEESAED